LLYAAYGLTVCMRDVMVALKLPIKPEPNSKQNRMQ